MLEQPFLFFSMQLDETPALNRGRLFLCDYEKGLIGRWQATSGLGAYQGVGDWSKQGGGVIPATYNLANPIPYYQVQVKPVDLRHVKGVEGNAYPITPFSVQTKEGVIRSDLLIHNDANVPGSMGCIVLWQEDWQDFQNCFNRNCVKHEKVRLLVGYTY